MNESLGKHYDAAAAYEKYYDAWEAAGCFKGKPQDPGPTFTMVIPPVPCIWVTH